MALATQGAMTAWLSHQAGNDTLALIWSPPPPPPVGGFKFTLAGINDPNFRNCWIVLNVTAQDALRAARAAGLDCVRRGNWVN